MNAVLIPVNVRQACCHLDDHNLGPFDHCAVPDIGDTEIEITILIHRGGLQDDHVYRLDEATIIVRHLPQVERHVVTAPGIVFPPVVSREVPANPNTVHLMILTAFLRLIGGSGLAFRGRSGKLLILRFTPRRFRRARLETTRSWRISSSTAL